MQYLFFKLCAVAVVEVRKIAFSRGNQGFTLIELMIVVGVIGILVSVAAPQYRKYSNKARQSEAKIAFSAIYGLEKSFYTEYAAYIPSFDAIGYAPQGPRKFYNIYLCSSDAYTSTTSGYSGTTATNAIFSVGSPYALTGTWPNIAAVRATMGAY